MIDNRDFVCVGADRNYEWMLKWWWKNYSQHNDFPVAFMNFGMSESAVQFCQERGVCIDVSGNINKSNWFKKPLGMLMVPTTGKVTFMDIDCEVKKNLQPLFDGVSSDEEVGLTVDKANDYCKKFYDPPYASGVVVFKQGNEFIRQWDLACQKADGRKYRGDQELMNMIIREREDAGINTTRITTLPDKYQWLRLYGDPHPDSHIIHWTGEDGKYIIRHKILAMGNI